MAGINILRFPPIVDMRRIAATAFGLCAALSACPQEGIPATRMEMGFSSGFLYGAARELVYTAAGSDLLLSELDWPLRPLSYWGIDVSLERAQKTGGAFFADASLKAGLAGNTGTITDTDWANYDGVKTHFSAHECWTEQALLLDLRSGARFTISETLRLSAFVGAGYQHFRWTARDGYLQYADATAGVYEEWDSSIEKTAVYGTGMAYEQQWLCLRLGVGFSWRAAERLTLSAEGSFFPWAYCADQDDHYLTQTQYNEYMSGGYGAEGGTELRFAFGPSKMLSVRGSYRFFEGLRGDTTISAIGTNSASAYVDDTAGTAYGCFDLNIAFGMAL